MRLSFGVESWRTDKFLVHIVIPFYTTPSGTNGYNSRFVMPLRESLVRSPAVFVISKQVLAQLEGRTEQSTRNRSRFLKVNWSELRLSRLIQEMTYCVIGNKMQGLG